MKRSITLAVMLLLQVAMYSGCTPKVVVRKSGGVNDTGVKYYRPKPYLLISPAGQTVVSEDVEAKTKKTTTGASDTYVSMELQYLPDFSEEYSINVRPGLGNADVSFTLKDGWNLTELNQKIDSQFDENLTAIAEVVKAGASVASAVGPAKFTKDQDDGAVVKTTTKMVVKATNVPLGYYESVLGSDGCGGKKLYGWKYVGFAPFNSCPTSFTGENPCVDCNDPLGGPIYGLSFRKGIMVFTNLNALQGIGGSSLDRAPVIVEIETTIPKAEAEADQPNAEADKAEAKAE